MITFPTNPRVGDTVVDPDTGAVWMWDGSKWTFAPGQSPGPTPPPEQATALPFVDALGSSVSWGSSGQQNSLVTLTLPTGDWDVTGSMQINPGWGDLTSVQARILVNSVDITASQLIVPYINGSVISSSGAFGLALSTFRVDGGGAVNLQAAINYSGGTVSAVGYLRARQMG